MLVFLAPTTVSNLNLTIHKRKLKLQANTRHAGKIVSCDTRSEIDRFYHSTIVETAHPWAIQSQVSMQDTLSQDPIFYHPKLIKQFHYFTALFVHFRTHGAMNIIIIKGIVIFVL